MSGPARLRGEDDRAGRRARKTPPLAWLRLPDWPLRAKIAALLVIASVVPLAAAAFLDVREARLRLIANMEGLLSARGDALVGELDAFHRGYQRSIARLARVRSVRDWSRAGPAEAERRAPELATVLDVWPASDTRVRGAALLDAAGVVRVSTERGLVGADLAYHPYVREAAAGASAISDVHIDVEAGDVPTIAYAEPIRGPDGAVGGLVVLWIRAASFWTIARASNELAGPGSFAIVYDRHGIGIAHTHNQGIVFRPAGRLDPETVAALDAEHRFGARTRALLEEVRPFPEQFERARGISPDRGVFRGFAPMAGVWIYGVARRLESVPWTVFYMIPEDVVSAETARMALRKSAFAGVIIVLAVVAGSVCAALILKPLRALSRANASLARGDLTARVEARGADEVGRLGKSFNAMAQQIEAQATALKGARDELETRVQDRTAALTQTARTLELEVAERRRAEAALSQYAERLRIVHEIDQAVIAAKSPAQIAEAVLRPVQVLLGLPRVIVNIFDFETGQAEWLAAAGRRRVAVQPGVRFSLELMGDVEGLRSGRPQLVDVDKLPESSEAEALRRGGVRMYMVVPMISGGELIGGLSFGGPSAEFSAEQVAVAEQVAGQMVIAIEQARLLARVTRYAGELEERVQSRTRELEAAQAELVRKERLATLGQLAGSVAHELRNPLGVVRNATYFLRMMLASSEDARIRKHLAILEREVTICDRIITELLNFARSPGAKRVATSLQAVVRDYLDRAGTHAPVEIEVRLADDLPEVEADPVQLGQVLGNLVRNGVQAIPGGGRVTIETGREGDGRLFLAVADTGTGISPEVRARLFEPLFTTKATGVGLGLAIVKQLVEANGGTIRVESTLGEGSRFTITFPPRPDAPAV